MFYKVKILNLAKVA